MDRIPDRRSASGMAYRVMGRLSPVVIVAFMAAMLLAALPGCGPSSEQQTVVVSLRDDAAAADVEILQYILMADDRVKACVYVHGTFTPTEVQESASATQALGPESSPFSESRLEITLNSGLAEADRDALLESLEANLAFERTVYVAGSGAWWTVK